MSAIVTARALDIATPRGDVLVDDVSLTVAAGEIVAIVGRSGAGKTTLLRALAGLRRPTRGTVSREPTTSIGYVPQDDIVHTELTVHESVHYAALLRCGRQPGIDDAVTTTIAAVGLSDRADTPVRSLSGGQRKRVSIAVELVARPEACFLDEPTSGLDPVAAGEVMATLADLARRGTAVVFTSHHLADVRRADRIVIVASGGRVAFDGPPADAPAPYRLDVAGHDLTTTAPPSRQTISLRVARVPRRVQATTLARRNLIVLTRNRMSLTIMAGSPVAVVAMMGVLFRRGAAGTSADDVALALALSHWLAFASFFFGLTFGLLQIVGELPIARRDLQSGIDLDAYLLAKAVVLLPVLALVNTVMVTVLAAIGRIAGTPVSDAARLIALLGLGSLAGLAIGLLASAAVSGPAHATLALPMICFPAVLFGGAVVPVHAMTTVGRVIAATTSTRWSFEAINPLTTPVESDLRLTPIIGQCLIAAVAFLAARAVLLRRTAAGG